MRGDACSLAGDLSHKVEAGIDWVAWALGVVCKRRDGQFHTIRRALERDAPALLALCGTIDDVILAKFVLRTLLHRLLEQLPTLTIALGIQDSILHALSTLDA